MSLIGDAVAHASRPRALGFWFAGLSLPALTVGGLGAGLGMSSAGGLDHSPPGRVKMPASRLSTPFHCRRRADLGNGLHRLDLLYLAVRLSAGRRRDHPDRHASVPVQPGVAMVLIYKPLLLDTLDPLFLQPSAAWARWPTVGS